MHDAKTQELIKLVERGLEEAPYPFDGFTWAAADQRELAAEIQTSDRTVRRIIGKPPFVREHILIDGKQRVLLRLGETGPKTPRQIAKALSKAFYAKTKRNHSKAQFGCLVGLAKLWGEDAPAIFKTALDDWTGFMSCVKAVIEVANDQGASIKPLYLEYPSIPMILQYPAVAEELFIMQLQAAGKAHELSAAMRAKYPYAVPLKAV